MSLSNFYIPGKIWTPCLLQEMQRGPKILGKKKKDPLRKDEYKHIHFISESLKYGNREERRKTCGTRMQYYFFFLLVLMILKNSHLR